MNNICMLLSAGLRLAFLRNVSLKHISFTPGLFWLVSLCSLFVVFVISYITSEPPIRFEVYGFQSEGFSIALALLVGFLLSKILRLPHVLWIYPSLITSAGLVIYSITELVLLVFRWLEMSSTWELVFSSFALYWWFLILFKIVSSMVPYLPRFQSTVISVLLLVLTVGPSWLFSSSGLWTTDYYAKYKSEEVEKDPINVEQVLFDQSGMLSDALEGIQPQRPEIPDLFFISFGSYGGQDVFMKEVQYTKTLFDQIFETNGRSMALINNQETIASQPLATMTNLNKTLQVFAEKMNVDEDILFLYLTSHGSKDHKLSVSLEGMPLNNIPAKDLSEILKSSGIKWKVIVISACYSGGFIDFLKDEHTLVITAANKDRKSFGCSNKSEMTYFGRAFFRHALAETNSFVGAFEKAKLLVTEWEKDEEHSDPQIASSPQIEKKLAEWRASLEEIPPKQLSSIH